MTWTNPPRADPEQSTTRSERSSRGTVSTCLYRLCLQEKRAEFLTYMEVLDYTEATSLHHAALTAHVQANGQKRGAHGLVIAAHAAQSGRSVSSRDTRARFGGLPSVNVVGP